MRTFAVSVALVALVLPIAASCSGDGRPPAATPTQRDVYHVIQEMKLVFFEDSAIKALVDEKKLGTDFWVEVVPEMTPRHGEDGGLVVIAFAEPVSFEGQILVADNPCRGKNQIEREDPCLEVERRFTTIARSITNVQVIRAEVDVLGNRVYNVQQEGFEGEGIQELIDRLKAQDQ